MRIITTLGIKMFPASTSQAKGRIERLWKTLQDRLVTEFRINNITTPDEANKFFEKYIPSYNKKFAIKPASEKSYFSKVPDYINLDLLLYEILLNLLKFEHQIKDRTSRSLIRRNLLRFLNNFNFPNKEDLMKKIINYLISNLIEYYQNFLLLGIKKIDDNYKIINNFPLDINENDIIHYR